MHDYKELLDYDILKIKRKIVKKYHDNEYVSTKYLDDDLKVKIINDLMRELSLNELQAKALVEEKIKNNIRKNLLNLVGLGYKSDHYGIYAFCKTIRNALFKYDILPFLIIFGFTILLFY